MERDPNCDDTMNNLQYCVWCILNIVIPLAFQHLDVYSFFHFGSENKDFLKFQQLKWGKKMTSSILQYLGTGGLGL
jgi:hypothetical protein